jgi:IS605 OrfB family transposase
MEDAREARAKQIAHEIFAIALGVELAPPPEDKRERKKIESLHGVYRCLDRGPVNFIALENLGEYKTSAKQGRRENRQLTSWSHRRVHKILGELCELVGFPIVLVDPKFTSRFSAKDHSVGFRAEEVRKDDPRRSFWESNAKEEPSGWRAEFLSWLDKLPDGKSLLLPKKGGEFFVSLRKDSSLYQADLNAAYRIALRALAHRDRAELSGHVWIEKKQFIVDSANVFPDSIFRGGLPFKTIPNSEQLWEDVNGDLASRRCREINLVRFADWKISLSKQTPSASLQPDEEDDIPMQFT